MGIQNSTETAKLPIPAEATYVTASNTGGAGAQLIVSLPGAVGKTTYLIKAIITSQSPASQQGGVVTISDGTNTDNYQFVESTSAGGFMNLNFDDLPVIAVATNTAITCTIPTIAGGAATAIVLKGYQK